MNQESLDYIDYEDYENLIIIMYNKYVTLLVKKNKIVEIRKEIKKKLDWFVIEGFTNYYEIEKLTKKEFIFSFEVGEDKLLKIELFTEK